MDNREIRYNNLLYVIERAGGVAALAAAIGRSEKYLRQIVNKFQGAKDKSPRKVGDDLAKDIADWLKEEPYWMDQPHEDLWQTSPSRPVPADGVKPTKESAAVTIHQYDAAGSMGHGLDLPDQPGVIQNLRVSKEWLAKNVRAYSATKNLCVVTGFGDSMQPMFNPGDPLLVDLGVTTVEFDSVYFFRVDNLGYVKRLQRIPTEDGLVIRAISENKKAYEPFNITQKMDFHVIGRVLKVWRSQEF